MDAEQDMVVMVARVRAVCDQSAACVDGLLEAARLGKPLLLALAHQLVDDTRSELEASDGVFLAVARLKRWHDYAGAAPCRVVRTDAGARPAIGSPPSGGGAGRPGRAAVRYRQGLGTG